jgi:hypothetical protein
LAQRFSPLPTNDSCGFVKPFCGLLATILSIVITRPFQISRSSRESLAHKPQQPYCAYLLNPAASTYELDAREQFYLVAAVVSSDRIARRKRSGFSPGRVFAARLSYQIVICDFARR